MTPSSEFQFDAASALLQGKRENQEDALVADFAIGGDFGFVVLSDGMGGHNAGDIASKVVVTEVFSELKLQSGNKEDFGANVAAILRNAAQSANQCVRELANGTPATQGMGATLVAPVFMGDKLYWISIGDSPLFLYRGGKLNQLNEDHSMAPQIDFMVRNGIMAESVGRAHPDRNCLTSVLIGGEIPKIDCPTEPMRVREGDIIVVASDGLQYLSPAKLQSVLDEKKMLSSQEIAENFIKEINKLDDPCQDNVSFTVIKVASREHDAGADYDRFDNCRNIFLTDGYEQPGKAHVVKEWAASLRAVLSRLQASSTGLNL